MARRKKKHEEEEETGYNETAGEKKEKETREEPERDERQQQVIDGLKEKQGEHLDKVQEKLDADEDATSEIAELQESNLAIQRAKAQTKFAIPTGQEHSHAGAAGTCVAGPEAHAAIEALGGEVVDEAYSGHATIEQMEQPTEEPTPHEGETEREREEREREEAA
jgi:uncharacterized transporter YbjL